MKKKYIVALLLLSCAVFMGIKLELDSIVRTKIPGSSIIYVPSGKFLKYATFGYSSLFSDLVYLWAIQYYSDDSIPDRFQYLDHIFSIISDLDPHYIDPYEIGSLIAAIEAKDLDLAFRILNKGLERNPDQWIFPFEAGHFAQMMKGDYKLAHEYYRKAMEIEGAPPLVERLYADTAFKQMDYKTSLETWLKIYQTAEEERVRKIAFNHLYRIKSIVDIRILNAAVQKFRERYGHYPRDLSLLVERGFLKGLPKDLDGKDYLYSHETGRIKAPTIPWKR
jgi:tetratricopeptide (TPR) repeat protein